MQTGWVKSGTNWYYASASGAMQKGWVQVGKSWYYMTPKTGEMVTGRTLINGKWNNFNSNGVWTGIDK